MVPDPVAFRILCEQGEEELEVGADELLDRVFVGLDEVEEDAAALVPDGVVLGVFGEEARRQRQCLVCPCAFVDLFGLRVGQSVA